MVQIAPNLRLN